MKTFAAPTLTLALAAHAAAIPLHDGAKQIDVTCRPQASGAGRVTESALN